MAPFTPGRSAEAARAVVRLTDGAVDDLHRMMRKGDPQVVRWALKKMLLLEQNPEAGQPLLGNLVGWRKIVVGDRDWRVVWRVGHDSAGTVVVDVAEVWAFGARSEAEVYAEVNDRIASASDSPTVTALVEVLEQLGKVTQGLDASPEPSNDALPLWLRDALVKVVGLEPREVDAMNTDDAHQVWLDYTTGQR